MAAERKSVTRLAPSPTGALHLGNARTFLVNWALARSRGWKVLLRIEDLDGPRVKPEAVAGIQNTLRWLGIDWDEGPTIQSAEIAPHESAMRRLAETGAAFPCELTRGQIEAAASAPQEGVHELRYAPELRPKAWERRFSESGGNWRFLVPSGTVSSIDEFLGRQTHDVSKIVGDFIVWTKRRSPSYQLAVVVDDQRQGVSHVVRGDDLLDSAARQLQLYRALGLGPEPAYCHLPLVVGADGLRLAKRHGDTRVDAYREAGIPAERVIGLLGYWCGLADKRREMSPSEFLARVELDRIPKTRVVFSGDDASFLT